MPIPRAIDYWDHVYDSGSGAMFPSQFAISILPDLKRKSLLLDCGCGNGRDSVFFSQYGIEVVGVDGSRSAIERLKFSHTGSRFEVLDFSRAEATREFARLNSGKFDVIYARFFLHAVDLPSEQNFWSMTSEALSTEGRVCIEVRSVADMRNFTGAALSSRELVTDHYRRFIDLDELMERGAQVGMKCIYRVEGQGLAKFKTEDPSIGRAIFSRA